MQAGGNAVTAPVAPHVTALAAVTTTVAAATKPAPFSTGKPAA